MSRGSAVPVARGALSCLIALAFIGFVQWYIGWAVLVRPWLDLPPSAVLVPTVLYLLTHGLRALRVHDQFGTAVQGRRAACLRVVLRHKLFNNLLPMRSGEVAFPVLMARRFGVPSGESVPALLWFRALDLHSVLLFAGPTLLLPGWNAAAVAAVVGWLALPWIFCRFGRPAVTALAARAPALVGGLVRRLLRGVPEQPAVFWRTYGWTLASWGLKLSVFAWVLMLFAPLEPAQALLGAIGGELTSVLPVHGVAGLGTYEAGVAAALVAAGDDPAHLVRAAANLHLFLLGATLIGGALAWLPARRRVDRPTPSSPERD